MATKSPIRYINDGEPLNEVTLNRSTSDVNLNLESLFSSVEGYDNGTPEAQSNRVVLRDDNATAKFGVPSDEQHPWRLNEFQEYMFEYFEETDRSNTDPLKILNYDHLPKATATTPGITQLISSYTSSDGNNAPTAEALGDFYRWLIDNDLVALDRLPKASTSSQGIVQLDNSCGSTSTTRAPTSAALNACLASLKNDLESQIDGSVPDVPDVLTYSQILAGQAPSGGNESNAAASGYAVYRLLNSLVTDSGFNLGSSPAGVSYPSFTGYFKLPSGLLVQFGRAFITSSAYVTVNLPTAFSSRNRFSVVCCEGNGSGVWDRDQLASIAASDIDNATSSSFRLYGKFIQGPDVLFVDNIQTISWVAMGEAP